MTRAIRRWIIILSLAILSLCFSLILVSLNSHFINTSVNSQKSQLEFLSDVYSLGGIEYFEGENFSEYRVTIIDETGAVVWDSIADEQTMENHGDREEIKEAFETGYGEADRQSQTLSVQTYYNAKKIADDLVLRISTDQETITSYLYLFVPSLLLIGFIIILASYIVAKIISGRIVKPINSINLDKPLNNVVYDELYPLLIRIDNQNRSISANIRKLNEKNQEISYVTENVSDGILVIDKYGKIITANKKSCQLLTCEVGEYYIDSFRNVEYLNMVKLALGNVNSSCNIKFGDKIYRFSASAVASNKKKSFVFIFITDITEDERALEMRRQFTANVSHELKTPLASIMGTAEIISNGIVKPSDVGYFAKKIHDESARLLELIQDIIKISRMDEGGLSYEFKKVRLDMICDEVKKALAHKAGAKNVSITGEYQQTEIQGFEPVLYEMVYNLCDNAVSYNKEHGCVEISISKEDNLIILRVKDNGIGISQEDLPRVFERFYRADKSHSNKISGGTGLGLSIVKHGASLHKAEIDIESELGKGTTITVKFHKTV